VFVSAASTLIAMMSAPCAAHRTPFLLHIRLLLAPRPLKIMGRGLAERHDQDQARR
jgi:hypothetical protein